MRNVTLPRLAATIGLLAVLAAASCRRDGASPGQTTPGPGTPGGATKQRRWTPIPTRVPPTHLPGQPTPLPELPG
jgi:hypothetical protein